MSRNQGNYVSKVSEKEEVKDKCKVRNKVGENCNINAITRKDKYPLPLTSELLDTLSRAKVFTKIDLKHAYHLIQITARDE
jgi:hypothetical protein